MCVLFLLCMYVGNFGVLGHGVCESIEIPRRVRALEMLKVKQIATGAAHTGKITVILILHYASFIHTYILMKRECYLNIRGQYILNLIAANLSKYSTLIEPVPYRTSTH